MHGKPGHVIEARYFYFDTGQQVNSPLGVVYGGYETVAPDYSVQRQTYPWYVIEYPLAGRCRLAINHKEYVLEKGVVAGFAPGDAHDYTVDPEEPMEHYFVAFTGEGAGELFAKSSLAENKRLVLFDPHGMGRLFDRLMEAGFAKRDYAQELCVCYLRAFLLELSANLERPRAAVSHSRRTYQRCREYIDGHFSLPISPGDVAGNCGVNVRYMSRLFRQFQAITPQEYIKRLRLNKAATLLLSSEYSIKEIAALCGFSDPYYFSRAFKDFHSRSPQKYRRAYL